MSSKIAWRAVVGAHRTPARPIQWLAAAMIGLAGAASAGEADVLSVDVSCDSGLACRFDVTVRHADAGWSHYADRWEVLSPDGELLATRVLAHPHDNEQPFTRSLTNVSIPEGLRQVTVRARDSMHGYGGDEVVVDLPGR